MFLKANMAKKSMKKDQFFRLGFLVHDVSRLRRTIADKALKPIGLTRSQFWVLSTLARHEGASMVQTELANVLDLGKVGLGGLLDRLEENGLIVRVPDPIDRRAKRIEMTPAGIALCERGQLCAVEINANMLQGISEEEIALVEDILSRMKRQMLGKADEISGIAAK
jgi:DNA-binding MarR family transcriptional regulator